MGSVGGVPGTQARAVAARAARADTPSPPPHSRSPSAQHGGCPALVLVRVEHARRSRTTSAGVLAQLERDLARLDGPSEQKRSGKRRKKASRRSSGERMTASMVTVWPRPVSTVFPRPADAGMVRHVPATRAPLLALAIGSAALVLGCRAPEQRPRPPSTWARPRAATCHEAQYAGVGDVAASSRDAPCITVGAALRAQPHDDGPMVVRDEQLFMLGSSSLDHDTDIPLAYALGHRNVEQYVGPLEPGKLQALPLALRRAARRVVRPLRRRDAARRPTGATGRIAA